MNDETGEKSLRQIRDEIDEILKGYAAISIHYVRERQVDLERQ